MSDTNVDEVRAQSKTDDIVRAAIESVPLAMVLTDPRLDDNPITYVNTAFEDITLYSRKFAVGRNCRFLQGEDTDPKQIQAIRRAVEAGEDITVDLLNYKADGTRFRNRLMISPIHDETDQLIAFVGIQREITRAELEEARIFSAAADRPLEDTMLMEVQHRVKNHLAMLVSLIRMQATKEISRRSFDALSHRVRSLALLYDELSHSGVARHTDDTVAAGAYLNRICTTLATIEGRGSIRVNVQCDEIKMPVDLAARLGLLVTEFVTNALEHAFAKSTYGVITVRFQRLSSGRARVTIEDDGCGLPEGSNWPWSSRSLPGPDDRKAGASGLGGSLVMSIAESMDAEIEVRSTSMGTIVTIDVPSRDRD